MKTQTDGVPLEYLVDLIEKAVTLSSISPKSVEQQPPPPSSIWDNVTPLSNRLTPLSNKITPVSNRLTPLSSFRKNAVDVLLYPAFPLSVLSILLFRLPLNNRRLPVQLYQT